MDNSNPLVFNHCGYILYNLIQYLIILPPQQQEEEDDESLDDDHSEEDEDNPSGTYENNFQSIRRNYQYKKSKNTIKANKQQQKIEEEEQKEEIMRMKGNLIIEYLESKRGIQFWEREDINQDHPQIKSTSQLCTLVILILDCLSIKFPNLREEWGPEAFAWAISCPDSHWRCRSFQIYRSLKPQASAEIINNLLSILIKYLRKLLSLFYYSILFYSILFRFSCSLGKEIQVFPLWPIFSTFWFSYFEIFSKFFLLFFGDFA